MARQTEIAVRPRTVQWNWQVTGSPGEVTGGQGRVETGAPGQRGGFLSGVLETVVSGQCDACEAEAAMY